MNEKFGPQLRKRLEVFDATPIEVNVLFEGESAAAVPPDFAHLDRATKIAAIRRQVEIWQQSAITALGFTEGSGSGPAWRPVWLNNSVYASVDRPTLDRLAALPEVVQIELARHIPVAQLLDGCGVRFANARTGLAGKREFAAVPSTPMPTWSVTRIGAPQVWQQGIRGERALIAVIDTGVNFGHPDLHERAWNGGLSFPGHGWNFEIPDQAPDDPSADGHGTRMAGLVAGDGTAGWITGAAKEARIMALRVGDAEENAWSAVDFALQHGVHVLCMAMTWKDGTDMDRLRWRRVCSTALALGLLHANSCGNDGDQSAIGVPGSCPPPWLNPLQEPRGGISSAITCGATDQSNILQDFSGRGPVVWTTPPFNDYPMPGLLKPDISAPGAEIVACNHQFQTGHAYVYDWQGTSPATGAVAGCLALLADACLHAGKPILPAQVQEALERTAVRGANAVMKDNSIGAGRINVYDAFCYGRVKGWWG
jgi:subtilisin family serine protease